jgi:hypothetical protein
MFSSVFVIISALALAAQAQVFPTQESCTTNYGMVGRCMSTAECRALMAPSFQNEIERQAHPVQQACSTQYQDFVCCVMGPPVGDADNRYTVLPAGQVSDGRYTILPRDPKAKSD